MYKEKILDDNMIITFERPKKILVDDPIFSKRVMTHAKLERIKREFLDITKMALNDMNN